MGGVGAALKTEAAIAGAEKPLTAVTGTDKPRSAVDGAEPPPFTLAETGKPTSAVAGTGKPQASPAEPEKPKSAAPAAEKPQSAVAGTDLDPGLWSGKRKTRRVRHALNVSCKGTGREVYPGRTLDISRGGMLLGLTCAAFRSVVNASSIVELTGCVASLFPHGIDVDFLGGSLRVKALVVRVVLDLKAAYPLLVGCRFEPLLTEVECAALGIPISQDETRPDGPKLAEESNDIVAPAANGTAPRAAAPAPVVPAPAVAPAPAKPEPPPTCGGRVIVAHLFAASAQGGGARFSGHLSSAEGKDAVVLLTAPAGEADAVGWAAGLGMDVRATLLEGGAMMGELRGKVRRLDPASTNQVRLTLLLAKAFSPA